MERLKRVSHVGIVLLSFVVLIIVSTYFQHAQHEGTSSLLASGPIESSTSSTAAHNKHGHHHRDHIHARRHSDTASPAAVDVLSLVPDTNVSLLMRRDDYSCGPGKPCANGACCGASGYCGYGDTYCGDGCVSNCGAVAECGKDASPSGRKCPLNTCCSQYGFCGTTEVSRPSARDRTAVYIG